MKSDQVKSALTKLPGWELAESGDSISRDFKFADFKQAFEFMTSIAGVAERLNHHPEWTNVYSRVSVTLSTHDAGGVTDLDIDLAKAMNAAAERLEVI